MERTQNTKPILSIQLSSSLIGQLVVTWYLFLSAAQKSDAAFQKHNPSTKSGATYGLAWEEFDTEHG